MSVYVVDSSVVVKWFFKEEFSDIALRLFDKSDELHVPDFMLLELDNVVCKRIRRREIDQKEGDIIRKSIRHFPLNKHDFKLLLDSSYQIANRTRSSIYDCLYVALAITIDGKLVTADKRFYNSVNKGQLINQVIWIEDFGKPLKMSNL